MYRRGLRRSAVLDRQLTFLRGPVRARARCGGPTADRLGPTLPCDRAEPEWRARNRGWIGQVARKLSQEYLRAGSFATCGLPAMCWYVCWYAAWIKARSRKSDGSAGRPLQLPPQPMPMPPIGPSRESRPIATVAGTPAGSPGCEAGGTVVELPGPGGPRQQRKRSADTCCHRTCAPSARPATRRRSARPGTPAPGAARHRSEHGSGSAGICPAAASPSAAEP
jgi:hypothetical protein